jgi:hypothetical protein
MDLATLIGRSVFSSFPFFPLQYGYMEPVTLCDCVACRLFQIVLLVVGLAMFTAVILEEMMLLGTRR